jgi:Holliday junction DNA helicase RuvA
MVARANGVGPKLAARIVNELKDKAGALPVGPAGAAVSAGVAMPEGNVAGDVVSALQNLGFKPNVAASATDAAIAELGEEAGVSALIRVALKKASG